MIHENSNISSFMLEYEDSVPIPKMMATSNFWVEMEIVFDRIWNGAKVTDELMHLSERLMSQVTGEPYEETYIDVPEESRGYEEYYDDTQETGAEE